MANMKMAEGVGFEPTREQDPLPVFKTGALNHSATLPHLKYQTLTADSTENKCELCHPIATRGPTSSREESRYSGVDRSGALVVLLAKQMRVDPQRNRWGGMA